MFLDKKIFLIENNFWYKKNCGFKKQAQVRMWGSMEVQPKAQVSLFLQPSQIKKNISKIIKNTNVSLAEGVCNHIHQRILVPIPISQYMVGTSLPHPNRNTELKALVFNSYQIQLSNIAISVQLTGRELHIFRHFLLSIISSLQLVIRITERKPI